MEELLEQLSQRVQSLLEKHINLQEAHETLQQNQRTINNKHQGAIAQIENMITRLKSLEKA